MYCLRLRCSQLNVLIFGAYSKLNILNFSVHWIYTIWKAPYIDRRRQFVESLKKARSADRVLIPKSPSTRRHISAGNPLSGLVLSRSVAHPRVPTGIWGRTTLSRFSHFFLGSPQTIKSAHARFTVLPWCSDFCSGKLILSVPQKSISRHQFLVRYLFETFTMIIAAHRYAETRKVSP